MTGRMNAGKAYRPVEHLAAISGCRGNLARFGRHCREEMAPTKVKVRTNRDLRFVLDHLDAGSALFDGLEVDREVRAEGHGWRWRK